MGEIKGVVLAAGKGTRLRTEGVDLPKVMRLAAGQPLIAYVLNGLNFIPPQDIILVVGYQKQAVLEVFPQYPAVTQEEQLGTGHAVQTAAPLLAGFQGEVLVCCGDMPLMAGSTYQALVQSHREQGNVCTVLAGVAHEVLPYGRVVRDAQGGFAKIVEDKDCTPQEREIRELNAGVYLFSAPALLEALVHLRPENVQGEYYLTDVPGWLLRRGDRVGVCAACTPQEMLGVNTAEQLQAVEDIILQEEKA